MTKQNLSARQARWAELLSRYHFKIMYRPGAQNQKADALTRREEDVETQNTVKKEIRQQVMLPISKVDSQVYEGIENPIVALVRPDLRQLKLIDLVSQDNRTNEELAL